MPLPHTARTSYRQARLLPVFAMLALLVGCTQDLHKTEMIAPGQPDSATCLGRCDLLKTQCRQRQETRERACADWYAAAEQDYRQCRTSRAATCRTPTRCLGADLSICDQEYEGCFTACGGRVERRMRPWPGIGAPVADPAPPTEAAKLPPR
ncbi:MAG TPA: hypothetical protein VES73_18800 [Lamprocystis sp. (in: g-proteobacteria)]|nr:hypothetical protein [Lamprocystis sp. (in: g-proteobacteria)]